MGRGLAHLPGEFKQGVSSCGVVAPTYFPGKCPSLSWPVNGYLLGVSRAMTIELARAWHLGARNQSWPLRGPACRRDLLHGHVEPRQGWEAPL